MQANGHRNSHCIQIAKSPEWLLRNHWPNNQYAGKAEQTENDAKHVIFGKNTRRNWNYRYNSNICFGNQAGSGKPKQFICKKFNQAFFACTPPSYTFAKQTHIDLLFENNYA